MLNTAKICLRALISKALQRLISIAAYAAYIDEYRQMLESFKNEQNTFKNFHHNWCKQPLMALKQNKPIETYHIFLSGPGGVGKSS